jgi:ribosome-associated toxin RatA of RatAB toxin-antitoxin module
MHSTIGIDIAAPPALVFALSRDPERWARLLPHYVRSHAVGTRRADGTLLVDFVARRPLIDVLGLGLPVTWRARTCADPATFRLRFVHVAGATKGMDVTWRIAASPSGTRLEIDHDFRPALPLVAVVVDRFFTRPIAGRTLATFKALAEALTESSAPDESGASADANPPT